MKIVATMILALGCLAILVVDAHARIKYIDGYIRRDGSHVSGHYRDTSNDGNPYNNANYLGYNDGPTYSIDW